MMLHLPMAETEFDFIVSHPVFQSPYWFDNEKIINIKDSEEAFEKACAAYEQKIDKTEEPLLLMYSVITWNRKKEEGKHCVKNHMYC